MSDMIEFYSNSGIAGVYALLDVSLPREFSEFL